MIQSNQKTSLFVPSQFPEFIQDNDNYQNFVLFVQAYYEWMEQNGNVLDQSKSILDDIDIDETSQQFLQYFINEFLPYFPQEILADERKVIKIAKSLYQTKGTESAYKFLFRVLYNTEVDFFLTKDVVLKASAGNWYVPRSLKLVPDNLSDLVYFENINELRIFGETSKSVATIENSVLAGTKVEIFISNIERLFQSGEYVDVVDSRNQLILTPAGNPIRAKIVGQIGSIRIDPANLGNLYLGANTITGYPGDPVIVSGGLSSPTGHGATAYVGTTTTGQLQRITVNTGGYGYTAKPNTLINLTNSGGALASVFLLDQTAANTANATFVPIDYIGSKTSGDVIGPNQGISLGAANYGFSNIATSNANTTLANAFSFIGFQTFPILAVSVDNGGGGLTQAPGISAQSNYNTLNNVYTADLARLGILGPIQITNGGVGYTNNDTIIISGGTGRGAYANIKVNANGSIVTANYSYKTANNTVKWPLGGMGYNTGAGLPTILINSTNTSASNGSLVVTGILGAGASFTAGVSSVGSIQSINVTDYGQDYISAPIVTLKVQDIAVTNLLTGTTNQPQPGDLVYQGDSYATATYTATVNSLNILQNNGTDTLKIWQLRVTNYSSVPVYGQPLKIVGKSNISPIITNQYASINPLSQYNLRDSARTTGVITYGDGTAKAFATFLNGLVIGAGSYLDSSGQLSGSNVLQSEDYNNYTYEITLEKEIEKYRSILLNLLHPAGMKVRGRFAMNSANNLNYTAIDVLNTGHTLQYYTQAYGSNVTMSASFTNPSSNSIYFNNLAGAPLGGFIFANSQIRFTTANNETYFFEIDSINSENDDLLASTGSEDLMSESGSEDLSTENSPNFITTKNSAWLAFANIAYVTANAGSSVINITSITYSYNVVNGGIYTNPNIPLMDMVRAGDTVKVNNVTQTVSSVDYSNNIVYLNGTLTYGTNGSSMLMSVNRTLSATAVNVQIFGPVGTQYFPNLVTESGDLLSTEDGRLILLD